MTDLQDALEIIDDEIERWSDSSEADSGHSAASYRTAGRLDALRTVRKKVKALSNGDDND